MVAEYRATGTKAFRFGPVGAGTDDAPWHIPLGRTSYDQGHFVQRAVCGFVVDSELIADGEITISAEITDAYGRALPFAEGRRCSACFPGGPSLSAPARGTSEA